MTASPREKRSSLRRRLTRRSVTYFQIKRALANQIQATPVSSKDLSDADLTAAFTRFYMQRATTEFSEDLDRLRGADDFKEDALPLLIHALQQGTSLFSIDEQKRIVMARIEKEGKKAGD